MQNYKTTMVGLIAGAVLVAGVPDRSAAAPMAGSSPRAMRTWQPLGRPDVDAVLVRQTPDGDVVLRTAAGANLTLPGRALDLEDRQYVSAVHDAGTFRTWHLDPQLPPGCPATVVGAFVGVRCVDLQFSVACVELIDDAYHRRWYPLKAFAPAEQKLATDLQAAADARRPAPVGAVYQSVPTEYPAGTPGVHTAESAHFVFYWGDDHAGTGHELFDDPTFIPRQQAWFERVWDFFDRQMHAPMPMADQPVKHKLNVYIAGTGLAHHKEGFAFGGPEILMSPAALGPGSSVVPHEFTHTIQFYTGGFQQNPLVGWFWETHANWSCHQFMPGFPNALGVYFERQCYELNSSRDNYGSWPFLQYMAEDPRIGTAFCYDLWRQAKRNSTGFATEDPLQAIMRLGAQRGFFTGNGLDGFGDLIGRMAAHNVNWDYASHYFYDGVWQDELSHFPTIARARTLVQPVPDRPGFYRPTTSQSPRQYGVNMIDVVPSPGAETVTADFQGIVDEAEGSDWRATFVVVDARGNDRYGRSVHGGKVSIKLRPGDRAVTLAIAAAPTLYKPQAFRPGYGKKPRFPYEVSFANCRPAAAPPQMRENDVPGHRHANGGGFVADSATVAPTAFVGPDARVLGAAKVLDDARVEGHAVIAGNATVSGRAVVGGWAHVLEQATVADDARVRDCAVVRGQAVVGGTSRVLDYVAVQSEGRLGGAAIVKGFGEVNLGPKAPVEGSAILGEDLEVYLGAHQTPIDAGLIYGFTDENILDQTPPPADHRGLYAHWDMSQPRKAVLKDAYADNAGVLRGAPRFVVEGGRSALSLNGRDQYAVVEGQVADAAELTVDAQVRWAGGPREQCLFEFAGPGGAVTFTPADRAGKAAVTLVVGTARRTLAAPAGLPVGRWSRVTVSVAPDAVRLFINGKPAGQTTRLAPASDPSPPTVGYLGRRAAGGGFFNGLLGDVAVYRRATADVSALDTPTGP